MEPEQAYLRLIRYYAYMWFSLKKMITDSHYMKKCLNQNMFKHLTNNQRRKIVYAHFYASFNACKLEDIIRFRSVYWLVHIESLQIGREPIYTWGRRRARIYTSLRSIRVLSGCQTRLLNSSI